jgi:hypothetical protein
MGIQYGTSRISAQRKVENLNEIMQSEGNPWRVAKPWKQEKCGEQGMIHKSCTEEMKRRDNNEKRGI